MARKSKLYVAYGSNLQSAQMKERCPDARVVGRGYIDHHLLTFRTSGSPHGVATIIPCSASRVPVVVWRISHADERNLDVYEGFPWLYRKRRVCVKLDGQDMVTAMAYVMNPGFRPAPPSPWYLDTIRQGYRIHGLDLDFLRAAVATV